MKHPFLLVYVGTTSRVESHSEVIAEADVSEESQYSRDPESFRCQCQFRSEQEGHDRTPRTYLDAFFLLRYMPRSSKQVIAN